MRLPYKLLALDLDGTTIGPDLIVSPENMDAISQVSKSGVTVAVITGKMFAAALPICYSLEKADYLFASNGANVYDLHRKQHLANYPLDSIQVAKIIAICEKLNVKYRAYTKDEMYAAEESHLVHEIRRDYPQLPVHIGPIPMRDDYMKIYAQGEEGVWEKALQQVALLTVQVHVGGNQNFEITNASANKGNALSFLKQMLDLRAEEILAIGNHDNDLPMFAEAGFSIAVGDAPDFVKEKADFVTRACGENGVAHALYDIFQLK